jgi:hypothetical protein
MRAHNQPGNADHVNGDCEPYPNMREPKERLIHFACLRFYPDKYIDGEIVVSVSAARCANGR